MPPSLPHVHTHVFYIGVRCYPEELPSASSDVTGQIDTMTFSPDDGHLAVARGNSILIYNTEVCLYCISGKFSRNLYFKNFASRGSIHEKVLERYGP